MSGPTESASRFILRTFLDTTPDKFPYTVVKVRDYGDGLVEAGWTKIEEPLRKRKKRTSEHKPRSEMSQDDIERSVRRAKATVRRKIMASAADHLLTLTYRENIEDESRAWADWAKFTRKVRAALGEFRHVVVAEKQKRGAYHFHAAVVGFQDVRLLRKLWQEVIGEGNIDVQFRGNRKGTRWKRNRLAAYLCKYISKTFDLDSFTGRHRYRCSKGITINENVYYLPSCPGMEGVIISRLFREISGTLPAYWWEPDDGSSTKGWACSWS